MQLQLLVFLQVTEKGSDKAAFASVINGALHRFRA